MSRALQRILRLRSLLEEESRIQLEKLALQLARIEDACAKENGRAAISNDVAFSSITRVNYTLAPETVDSHFSTPQAAKEAWLLAMTDREVTRRRQEQLEKLARAVARLMEVHREEMITRRKERLQVETVLRNEAALRKDELDRRQQRILDDWFLVKRKRTGR